MKTGYFPLLLMVALASCKKDNTDSLPAAEPQLVFQFKFDSTQARLNNIGMPAVMPAGHAGQNPRMNRMSAHYIELAPSAFTALGAGSVVYRAPETSVGGSQAIEFSKSNFAGNNQTFYSIPLKSVAIGEYDYLRVSLAYQNFDVNWHIDTVFTGVPGGPITFSQDNGGTVAAFVGFNSYITSHKVKNTDFAVNGNRKQGYWAFETSGTIGSFPFTHTASGQSPDGATTVVNPINSTSPIPPGSCLVTGAFAGGKLRITGSETKNVVVIVSLSTNKSFEWGDTNGNNKWDPTKGEPVFDMGLRGMIPSVQ